MALSAALAVLLALLPFRNTQQAAASSAPEGPPPELERLAADLQKQMDELIPLRNRLEGILKRYSDDAPLPEGESSRTALRQEIARRTQSLKGAREDFRVLCDRYQSLSLFQGIVNIPQLRARLDKTREKADSTNFKSAGRRLLQANSFWALDKEVDDFRIKTDTLLAREDQAHDACVKNVRRGRRNAALFAAGVLAAAAVVFWLFRRKT